MVAYNVKGNKLVGRAEQLLRAFIDKTTTPEAVAALEPEVAVPGVAASVGTEQAKQVLETLTQGSGGGAAAAGSRGWQKFMSSMHGFGPFLALLGVELAGQHGINQYDQIMRKLIETGALKKKRESLDPAAAYYEAILPEVSREEEMSRMALMNTIMGGGTGPNNLAKGQEVFGGA